MPAEVFELINVQALKSTSITMHLEIKIGGILLDDNNIDEYKPYVPAQRVAKLRDGLMTEIFDDNEPDQESKIIEDKIMDTQTVPQGIGSRQLNIQEPELAPMEYGVGFRLHVRYSEVKLCHFIDNRSQRLHL
jgi:hypothetical protein